MTAAVASYPVLMLYFIVIAFAALWSALFLQGKFAPTLKISNTVEWMKNGLLRITISVENVGFVRCNIEKALCKVSAPDIQNKDNIQLPSVLATEWVDLGNAELIFKSTTHLTPKEIISCDRIYSVGSLSLLHIGTQVVFKNPWYIHMLGPKARTTRQTNTAYACSPNSVLRDKIAE